nr:MAG TPA: hypothetical protein [Caudoviricetes sp.]
MYSTKISIFAVLNIFIILTNASGACINHASIFYACT